jgi:hypothetical protein
MHLITTKFWVRFFFTALLAGSFNFLVKSFIQLCAGNFWCHIAGCELVAARFSVRNYYNGHCRFGIYKMVRQQNLFIGALFFLVATFSFTANQFNMLLVAGLQRALPMVL